MALWRVLDRGALRRGQAPAKQRKKNPAKMRGNSFSEKQTRDNAVSHASM